MSRMPQEMDRASRRDQGEALARRSCGAYDRNEGISRNGFGVGGRSEDSSGGNGLIRTGIAVELPYGTYGRIATRSSLAVNGIEVGGGVIIDRDFRGEVMVLLRNQSAAMYHVRIGDRIAQLVVEKIMEVSVQEVQSLSPLERGDRGFGHSVINTLRGGESSFSARGMRKLQVREDGSGVDAPLPSYTAPRPVNYAPLPSDLNQAGTLTSGVMPNVNSEATQRSQGAMSERIERPSSPQG